MLKIKKYNAELNDTNIVILGSYNSIRDLYVWKRINKVNNPVLRIPYKGLGLRAEQLNEPYFFVLHKNSLTVQNLFIPAKEFMSAYDDYLKIMKTKVGVSIVDRKK